MGTLLLQHSLDGLRADLAKEVEMFCQQLNLSFQAHLTDMSSSVGRLLLVDMKLLLEENTQLREELQQSKSASRKSGHVSLDTAEAHVPVERDHQEAPCSQIDKNNAMCLASSSNDCAERGRAHIVSLDTSAADANLDGVVLEISTSNDPHRSRPSAAKALVDEQAAKADKQTSADEFVVDKRRAEATPLTDESATAKAEPPFLADERTVDAQEAGTARLSAGFSEQALVIEHPLRDGSTAETTQAPEITFLTASKEIDASQLATEARSYADKRNQSVAYAGLESCSSSPGRFARRTRQTRHTGRFGASQIQRRSTLATIAGRITGAMNMRGTHLSGWRASSKSSWAAGNQRKSSMAFWRASRKSSALFGSYTSSAFTQQSLQSMTSILDGMEFLKSDNSRSEIQLLPQWEDMVSSVVNDGQVEEGRSNASFRQGDSYVENHLKWARHPASSERFFWEGISMFLVVWDMLVVPLAAFDISESPLSLFAFIFWNLDIIFSMVTGYQVGSRIEMRLRWTSCHYLQTWFAFDLLVVAPEWVLICLGSDGADSIQRFGNLALVLRVLKVSKLLRILRLLRAWSGIRSRLRYHATFQTRELILQFVKLSSLVLLVNHYSACAWYGIGKAQGDDGWVARHGLQISTLEYKYLTSFHWAMSQFHGNMDVHAATSIERVYSLACEFVGMVAASLFISSITSLAMRAQKLRQEKFLQKLSLAQYLEENNISTKLMMQIKTFVSQTTDDTTNKSRTVELLKILPSHLREELAIEVKIPVLQSNFVSTQIVMMLPRVKKEFCTHVVKEVDEKPGRLIFEYKEASRKAFIVWKGQAVYSVKDESNDVQGNDEPQWAPRVTRVLTQAATRMTTVARMTRFGHEAGLSRKGTDILSRKGTDIVEPGTCIGQMNLFTSWHHRGECILRGSAIAFAIDAEDLKRFLTVPENHNFELVYALAKHAVGFVQSMRVLPPTELNDLFEYHAQDM